MGDGNMCLCDIFLSIIGASVGHKVNVSILVVVFIANTIDMRKLHDYEYHN